MRAAVVKPHARGDRMEMRGTWIHRLGKRREPARYSDVRPLVEDMR